METTWTTHTANTNDNDTQNMFVHDDEIMLGVLLFVSDMIL